jgi:hypothetical protein
MKEKKISFSDQKGLLGLMEQLLHVFDIFRGFVFSEKKTDLLF